DLIHKASDGADGAILQLVGCKLQDFARRLQSPSGSLKRLARQPQRLECIERLAHAYALKAPVPIARIVRERDRTCSERGKQALARDVQQRAKNRARALVVLKRAGGSRTVRGNRGKAIDTTAARKPHD